MRCARLLLLLWGAGGVEDNGGADDGGGNTCFFFFDGGPWRITCLRCCVSGSGDDNVSFYLLFFCERVGAPDILVGVWLVLAAGILGGGGLFFRSPVLLLATADLLLLFLGLDDDSRCAWEAIYSASVPSKKSSSAVSPTSWGSRRVSGASCSLCENPRTLLSNLSGLRVLYANLHLWTMGIMDYVVKFLSSRVLVVKAQLL